MFRGHQLNLKLFAAAICILTAECSSPTFPRRFSANIKRTCISEGGPSCYNFPDVLSVNQDLDSNSALWTGEMTSAGPGYPWRQQDLVTTLAGRLSRITWDQTNTTHPCSYAVVQEVPPFFNYSTTHLEKKEIVDGVKCEKWTNNGVPNNTTYVAVWYAAATRNNGAGEMVVKAQYIDPGIKTSFPVPGWTATYSFSDFSTTAVPAKTFAPPAKWVETCTNMDGGVAKSGLPNRQDGYLCVSKGKRAKFSLNLLTKPVVEDVTIQVDYCNYNHQHYDGCVDGKHCKDCAQVKHNGTLHFTPENWETPQQIEVSSWKEEGDSQFKISSPDYFIKNMFSLQFSVCACEPGDVCSNNCQAYCGSDSEGAELL